MTFVYRILIKAKLFLYKRIILDNYLYSLLYWTYTYQISVLPQLLLFKKVDNSEKFKNIY